MSRPGATPMARTRKAAPIPRSAKTVKCRTVYIATHPNVAAPCFPTITPASAAGVRNASAVTTSSTRNHTATTRPAAIPAIAPCISVRLDCIHPPSQRVQSPGLPARLDERLIDQHRKSPCDVAPVRQLLNHEDEHQPLLRIHLVAAAVRATPPVRPDRL